MKNRLHGRHLVCAVLVYMGLVLGCSPAHADSSPVNATVALTGGELSIQVVSNSALPPIVLNGASQGSEQRVGGVLLRLTDATGTGLGHTLAVSATPLSGSNGSMKRPLRLRLLEPAASAVSVAGSGTLPGDRGSFISPSEGSYWTIPSTPATLYSAANGKGMGQWDLRFIRFAATISPEDLAGEYTSIVTFTVTQTPP